MATHRYSVLRNVILDAAAAPDLIGNQITAATAPSIGRQLCYVLTDAGSDVGLQFNFPILKNYVGTPKLAVRGVLDGAPGAADTLGFGFRKRAVANNEVADGTYDAEEVVTATIGSNGSGYSDEDSLELLITLTAADYAVDDNVYGYLYVDTSGTTYAGNFLLTDVIFEYTDA